MHRSKSDWLVSELGHSRRYCHVRSVVPYPQHRTLPHSTETRLPGRVPASDPQITGTTATAPVSDLRSTRRCVTHVRPSKSRHNNCSEPARNLPPTCSILVLPHRSLAKGCAGTAERRPPTERLQDKSGSLHSRKPLPSHGFSRAVGRLACRSRKKGKVFQSTLRH